MSQGESMPDPSPAPSDRSPQATSSPGPTPRTYVALPAVAIGDMVLFGMDPVLGFLVSILVAYLFWIAFARLNPRVTGMVLIGTVLVTYYVINMYPVLWVASAALAGGAGALLDRWPQAHEDDFFFLPAAAGIAAFLFLICVGNGFRVDLPVRDAERYLREMQQHGDRQVEDLQRQGLGALLPREQWDQARPNLGSFLTYWSLSIWVAGLWVLGRRARRRMGRMADPRFTLILFRMRQRYIFLLIAGLILEILGTLSGIRACSHAARLLFVAVGLAGFVGGLSIMLFFLTLRRKLAPLQRARWLTPAGIILVFFFWQISLVVGLIDVWFDLRRRAVARLSAGSQP